MASNFKEIQNMKWLGLATRHILQEKIFNIFENLNNQYKVDIIFKKSFYLNGERNFMKSY